MADGEGSRCHSGDPVGTRGAGRVSVSDGRRLGQVNGSRGDLLGWQVTAEGHSRRAESSDADRDDGHSSLSHHGHPGCHCPGH